jgi:hypothetical protein
MKTNITTLLVTLVLLAAGSAQAGSGDPGNGYTSPGGGTLVAITNWLFRR